MSDYKYLGIKDIIESDKYPFTDGQLRHFLYYRHKNGLAKIIFKMGRRLYVRSDLFDAWLESKKG